LCAGLFSFHPASFHLPLGAGHVCQRALCYIEGSNIQRRPIRHPISPISPLYHSCAAAAPAMAAATGATALPPPASWAVSRRCKRMPVATLTFRLSTIVCRPAAAPPSSICSGAEERGKADGWAGRQGAEGRRGAEMSRHGASPPLPAALLPASAMQTKLHHIFSPSAPPAAWHRTDA
jgi:hypothetical protein